MLLIIDGMKTDNIKYIILNGLCLLIIADILALLGGGSNNTMNWIILIQFIVLIGMAFWTKSKPYSALLVSLIIFVLSTIVLTINTHNIIGGLAVKIFVVLYFSKYLPFAKKLQTHNNEFLPKVV